MQPGTPTKGEFLAIVGVLVTYSFVGGLMAGTQPSGAGWRLFSVRVKVSGTRPLLFCPFVAAFSPFHFAFNNSGILS